MKNELHILLKQIGPKSIDYAISARVDNAFNSFPIKPELITTMARFEKIGAHFYAHVENYILRLSPPRKPDLKMDFGRFFKQLLAIYGENGEKTAFELVLSNSEGGLFGVFKAVANAMQEAYAHNEISGRVSAFINNLSVDEKFEAMECFIKHLQYLFPDEIRIHGTIRIKANFTEYLIEYPKMIKRARNMARNF